MEVDQSDSDIPEFAQSWHPSVRRPIILPQPATYHESINPGAIFELRETPSSEYICVVPYSCVYCISVKQACSRLRPCTRCSNTARSCHAGHKGYQRLPPPKARKLRKLASVTDSTPQTSSVSRPKRALAVAPSATQPVATSSDPPPLAKKLKLAPASLDPPPGRPLKRKEVKEKEKVDANPPPQNVPPRDATATKTNTSTSTSTMPIWTPVKPGKTQCPNDTSARAPNIPALDTPPPTPRVWANSRAEMAAIFPELTKSVSGISWQKFDVPTLFLEHPLSEDIWRDDNTLEIIR
ncbi:hypothetical protein K503DRAFT_170143 [Rhizopogon vinicolor AM-OR11-026]|uniref:Zn(2)-C6 fungal-type domain-containing protein n=1 Tax=Rhizopogon vinicolor AM-OR11-026 TaxID=1314800 RepID=A0A1B7N0B9_9AGAM|nr:hypothetical protein K503DRAFT_170143 [Rhizopogon vinicolor AM-OR11-026]